ncbi:metallophosphoesterase family protein [Altericroceibacterium endophyticum]|uniref:Serine/threonine protein phosphatase n=1 Tax=Altericroceibacterium endophyticum TaxID=1808508 RepID=A0A6I4T6U0_9SPHN|nr:metallophosphoesterase family protein [Altericroceibacterium endophyticum]MXO66547.1 serine/threonine protein phosphatase [Altericroceibacterium endophyticum]
MINKLLHMLKGRPKSFAPQIPDGQRVYALGDIHGRLDLFEAMITAIEDDERRSAPEKVTIILLGDLIDRGPDSAGVVARARALQKARDVRILMGNHEEMLLRSMEDRSVLAPFLNHGGRETLLSYGLSAQDYDLCDYEELQNLLIAKVPARDKSFINSFHNAIEIGDYLFVHAGIEPGKALRDQDERNLRWIREPFLSHAAPHSHVVVHGHTITERPENRSNRIGLDTGAYRSGALTAVVLEGTERRYLQTRISDDGAITAAPFEADEP